MSEKETQGAENENVESVEVKEEAKAESKPEKKEETKTEVKEEPLKVEAKQEEVEEEFDWDEINNDEDIYKADERKDMEAMYDETLSTIVENEVIDGKVVAIDKREVVVNIGYKSDGIINANEFRYNSELKVGDTVELLVETQEDNNGQLVVSHKRARAMRSWDRVNSALDNNEIIQGFIKCRTKGGMIVDVFGIEAFLPGSQIDVKPIRDYDIYVEKTMEFKVVKINPEFRNVVVSHKALIEAELEQQKMEIISKLEKGQVLEGTVKNITSYGVFIDLGGVDGLIHITDLSWGRINHPEEVVKLDETINVVILDFDDNKKRIALGLKQLSAHPWDNLDPDLKVGDKVKGKVVVMADYGAFIEIATGVEGLVHVSEMSWSQHLRSAQDFMKVGDEVEAVVLTLERTDRKMSLGIKQLTPDPWENIEKKYEIGSKHSAKVRNFTNFGIFVELDEGIDGLIHISDLSWTKKVKHPAEFTAIGETLDIIVLEVDSENRRLSLGHKQIEENPWDVFEDLFAVGNIHEGTIIELTEKGAVVSLPYGVEGFATPKHLVKEDGTSPKLDDKLEFKVIDFSKEGKKIIVSHARIFEDANRTDSKPRGGKSKKGGSNKSIQIEKTTLGDVSALLDLKSKMEGKSKDKEPVKKVTAKKTTKKAEEKAETKSEEKAEKKPAKKVAKKEEVKEEVKVEAKDEKSAE